MKVFVKVTVAVSPTLTVAEEALSVNVSSIAALALGPVARALSPKATITASAMRLKLVFVDISFLSKVVPETFSSTADKDRVFVS